MKSLQNYITVIILIVIQLLILIKSDQIDLDYNDDDDIIPNDYKRNKRWAISSNFFRKWPNAIVNYKISCTEFTDDELKLIRSALDGIEDRTCVRFIQYDINDYSIEDYIDLQCIPRGRCKAQLGYLGGRQFLNLDRHTVIPKEYCVNYRKIQHEFLHALGFKHEHTSPSRDNYIEIMWENVKNGGEAYFAKDKEFKTYHYGCAFDYNSVMSVPSYRQSKNGKATIVPKDPNFTSDTIGIALSISECDVIRINSMYCTDKQYQTGDGDFGQNSAFARPPITLEAHAYNGPFGLNIENDFYPPAGIQAPIKGSFRQRNPNLQRQNRFNRPGLVNRNRLNNNKQNLQQERQNFRHDPISL